MKDVKTGLTNTARLLVLSRNKVLMGGSSC